MIKFVQLYENADFPTAVRRLAQRAGIPIVEEQGREGSTRDSSLRKRLLEMHREAAEWYHHALMKTPAAQAARDYLKSRGFGRETAVGWMIGYAPESWEGLLNHLSGKGYEREALEKSGLFSRREDGGGLYDRFRGRLMFPICNDYGEVIAFSGRVLQADVKEAKYVNSPETPLFSKGRILFGLHKTKRSLIDAGTAVVCEGQLDVISAFEAGVTNVTAPQGTAFTEDQARLLKRFVSSVVLCFDSDNAGQKAAERSLPALLAHGLEVRIAGMPEGEDPDSTIRSRGAEEFRRIVEKAEDFFDHTLEIAIRKGEAETPRQKSELARRMAAILASQSDSVMREATAARIALRLGVPSESMRDLIQKASRRPRFEERQDPVEESRVGMQEQLLASRTLEILLPHLLSSLEAREWLRNQNLEEAGLESWEVTLLQKTSALDDPDASTASARLMAQVNEAEQEFLARLEPLKNTPNNNSFLVVKSGWYDILRAHFRRRRDEMKALLHRKDISAEETARILKEILDLEKRLADIPKLSRWASGR